MIINLTSKAQPDFQKLTALTQSIAEEAYLLVLIKVLGVPVLTYVLGNNRTIVLKKRITHLPNVFSIIKAQ